MAARDRSGAVPARSTARVTVFAASAYGDIARLWLACLRQALPLDDVAFEVFDDSAEGVLDGQLLPGVAILRRAPESPDFQIAYNDALARAATPFLAFVDTDVFWVSRAVWPRVMREFERPEVAAVACVSRTAAASHGTFAVVMRTETYRDVLKGVPDRFAPFVEGEESGGAPGRWRGHDTGDLATRAVRNAGFEVKLLHLEKEGELVRFDAITNMRLLAEWAGAGPVAALAITNPYFRRGCLGSAALGSLHDALFAGGPRFALPVSRRKLWRALLPHPRALLRAFRDVREFHAGTRRMREFLASPQPAASISA